MVRMFSIDETRRLNSVYFLRKCSLEKALFTSSCLMGQERLTAMSKTDSNRLDHMTKRLTVVNSQELRITASD